LGPDSRAKAVSHMDQTLGQVRLQMIEEMRGQIR
jgi:hypothetical protein